MIDAALNRKVLAIGRHDRIVRCRTGDGDGSACSDPAGVLVDGEAVSCSAELARGIGTLHVAIDVASPIGSGAEAVVTVALGAELGAKVLIAAAEAGAVL